MGQQQLMLLILVTVIVGIMTVVAITLFSNSRDESIKDIIRQDVMEAATLGQMYYKKHPMLGGGGGTFNNITLNDIQLDSTTAINTFEISETSGSYFKLLATPTLGEIDPFTAVVTVDNVVWE